MTCSVRLTGRWELRHCTENIGCCCSLTPALPKYRASPAVDSRAAAGVLRASTAVGLEQAVVAAAAAAAASGPAHGPAVSLPAAAAQGVCGNHLDRSVLIHFSGGCEKQMVDGFMCCVIQHAPHTLCLVDDAFTSAMGCFEAYVIRGIIPMECAQM